MYYVVHNMMCFLIRSTLLVLQVSQVYESIELTRLVELAPFTTSFQLEKVVVETAHSNGIQVLEYIVPTSLQLASSILVCALSVCL